MKSVYPIVLFDLDGTLTESGPGIMASVQKTLLQIKQPEAPLDMLRTFIGPPLYQSFYHTYGLSETQSNEAVELYRQFYETEGIYKNSLYPYTQQLLTALRQGGAKLCIATSKPQIQADRVVKMFQLDMLVDYVAGPDSSELVSTKKELIQQCLDRFDMQPSQAVMIGDTMFDAMGAAAADTDFIGVLHGYGTQEEMQEHYAAARFAKDFSELEKMLLTN